MKGRRIPIPDGEFEPDKVLTQPGDYCGPIVVKGWYSERPMVWFNLPDFDKSKLSAMQQEAVKGPRLVCSPPHKFTEEEDGSLTIRESILSKGWQEDDGSVPELWHGYLTKGEWQQCQ